MFSRGIAHDGTNMSEPGFAVAGELPALPVASSGFQWLLSPLQVQHPVSFDTYLQNSTLPRMAWRKIGEQDDHLAHQDLHEHAHVHPPPA